jgi:hypothetical protein
MAWRACNQGLEPTRWPAPLTPRVRQLYTGTTRLIGNGGLHG